ncbi:hypothetical protein LCGC14_1866910 [marine sediment metagenome]|uniref:Uncharacterized protein n=1 Tax=marine sediment metagenome TaxID=412755 RepID=A0A0F9J4V6_9ZZZZ
MLGSNPTAGSLQVSVNGKATRLIYGVSEIYKSPLRTRAMTVRFCLPALGGAEQVSDWQLLKAKLKRLKLRVRFPCLPQIKMEEITKKCELYKCIRKAVYECEACGKKYCRKCAEDESYECMSCYDPVPMLVEIV